MLKRILIIITNIIKSNEINTLTIILKTKLKTCRNMFKDLSNIISIDVSNFDTSVIDMGYMFYNWSSLISLNLNNFDTSSIIDMNTMLYDCNSLESIEIENFKF